MKKNIYNCSYCKKYYKTQDGLIKHLEKYHPTKQNIIIKLKNKNSKIKLREYIKAASKVHNDKYDYSKVDLENRIDDKITIICPKHGEFIQRSALHKGQGNGCPECSKISVTNKQISSQKEVIEKFIQVHGIRYDYSKVKYEKGNTEVVIYCKICKEEFLQKPRHHKEGKGCPKCMPRGYDKKLPGRIYYVKIRKDNVTKYKIGITNATIKERFAHEMKYVLVLKERYYKDGSTPPKLERKVLQKFNEYRNWTEELLRSGNTEMFHEDVLNLDKSIQQLVELKSLDDEIHTQETSFNLDL